MTAYSGGMSTTETRRPSDDCPTAAIPAIPAIPTRRSILRPALPASQASAAPFEGWRGQAQTEELAAVPTSSRSNRHARRSPIPRHPLRRTRIRRHLRCALIGTLLAIIAISGLSAYAAAGIADARQAALEQASSQPGEAPSTAAEPAPAAPASGWVIEGTTVDVPSPLDLPRCTTSPDTPLPCLATSSPSQDRAVVLEEDASLTALVRR